MASRHHSSTPQRKNLILSCILLCTLLSACLPQHGTPAAPLTLITFACPRGDLSLYQDAAETFHQTNPSIHVHVIPLDESGASPTTGQTDALAPVRRLASQADTFFWSAAAVEGGPPGLLLDLTTFVEAAGQPAETDFLPGLLAHFQWQGRTWGLPAGVDPLFVLYDRAAFEAAGLEPPAPSWTWDDLFDAARQLTQQEDGQVVRYGFADPGLGSMRPAVEALGGRLVDETADPPVPTLDDPRTVAAVRTYTDLALTQGVMLNPAEEGPVDAFALVREGRAAMSVTLGRFWVAGGRNDALGVAPLPGKNPLWAYGYFISAGTAHPEAAWRWLQFLSREVAPSNCLPARQSLISQSAYAAAAGAEALQALQYAAEHSLPPVHPAAVEQLLRQAVERVLQGEDTQAVLDEAQQQALALRTPELAEPPTVPTPALTGESIETITFVVISRSQYEALADAFHQAHPEIKVLIQEAVDFGYAGGPLADLIAASGADCLEAGLPPSLDTVRSAVLNLQPFVDADPTFPLEDYYPLALEMVQYGGDLWGLPADWGAQVLWYNRTLFDEAGVPYPTGDWSWDDLFMAAQRLSAGEGEQRRYGFLWLFGSPVFLLEALVGPLADTDAGVPTFRFDDPEIMSAVRQLADLKRQEIIFIARARREGDAEVWDSRNLPDLIWTNRAAMWPGAPREFEREGFDFHPAPLPAHGSQVAYVSLLIHYIAADTLHAETCWQWLRFLANRVPPKGVPPRRSLLTSEAFREQVGAEAQAVYQQVYEGMSGQTPTVFTDLKGLPHSGRAYNWLQEALEAVLWEDADARAALGEAQALAEAYLACLRQRPDLEDEASAEACFERVDAQ